jgi:hypothetical protein
MASPSDGWVKRGKELLSAPAPECIHFAISFLNAIYGPNSAQSNAFNTMLAQIAKSAPNPTNAGHHQMVTAMAAINNTIAEIEGGLITSLRAVVAGEVFGELVGLGKEILANNTEASKNIAAVLIAAAFEDIIRRMGTELAGVQGRPELQDVVTALKNGQLLKGGEVSTAIGYLKFRNDSLHADWANVHAFQVQSCMTFIENLLVKHFS